MPLPTRKRLPHEIPHHVADGAIYFITICTQPKGQNQLCTPSSWEILQSAAQHYHQIGRWHLRLFLAMPDHIHLLASFPADESLPKVVTAWKHFTSHRAKIQWQRDFFDHRLRDDENLDAKSLYIRQNPLRANLVANLELWPYHFTPPDI